MLSVAGAGLVVLLVAAVLFGRGGGDDDDTEDAPAFDGPTATERYQQELLACTDRHAAIISDAVAVNDLNSIFFEYGTEDPRSRPLLQVAVAWQGDVIRLGRDRAQANYFVALSEFCVEYDPRVKELELALTTTTTSTIPRTTSTTRLRTTTTTEEATGSSRTTTPCTAGPSLCAHWSLNGAGLGASSFGDPADQALEDFRERLGPEDSDEVVDFCPSGQIDRSIRWGSLIVDFGSGTFVGWSYVVGGSGSGEPPLWTEEQVTVGTNLSDLRRTYDSLQVTDDPDFGVTFTARDYAGELTGSLSGTNDTDVVSSLSAGAFCGE